MEAGLLAAEVVEVKPDPSPPPDFTGIAGYGTVASAWVGVVTTFAAAAIALRAGARHAQIAASCAVTSEELSLLLSRFDLATADTAEGTAFVLAVEAVLAAQNQGSVLTPARAG